jgi:hypothetical protein
MSLNKNYYIVYNKHGDRVANFNMQESKSAHDLAKRIGGSVYMYY